jgi:hypothetical protein
MHSAFLAALVPTAAILLSGCGGAAPHNPTGTAKVHVAYGDQPVSEGSVQLVSPGNGKGSFGSLDAKGEATLTGVETGTYTVVVFPPAASDPDPQRPEAPKQYPNIPAKFRNQSTSPLKAEVKAGENDIRVDLMK